MSQAQGNRSVFAYKAETTFGTAATGNYQELQVNSQGLALNKTRLQGREIRPDRIPRHDRHGNRSVSGPIVTDFRASVYDELLESVMYSTWDTSPVGPDELKVGTTEKSFTFEDYAQDIDFARRFTGCIVSQASFQIRTDEMVTATFDIVGRSMTVTATQSTITPADETNVPHDSHSGQISLGNSGGSLSESLIITGIDFSINNTVTPTFVVGSDITQCMDSGLAVVEGTLTAYYEDNVLINRFIQETESAIKVTINDPTSSNEYGFFFPRVKFNGSQIPLEGPMSRLITMPFVALYDDTEGSNLVITRPDSS